MDAPQWSPVTCIVLLTPHQFIKIKSMAPSFLNLVLTTNLILFTWLSNFSRDTNVSSIWKIDWHFHSSKTHRQIGNFCSRTVTRLSWEGWSPGMKWCGVRSTMHVTELLHWGASISWQLHYLSPIADLTYWNMAIFEGNPMKYLTFYDGIVSAPLLFWLPVGSNQNSKGAETIPSWNTWRFMMG